MNSWFERFADWAKRKIASPRHFVGFLAISLVWLAWALSRQFDAFSQLVLNTPTTWAEYMFEILVLASAVGAEETAQQVLDAVLENQKQQTMLLEYIRDMVVKEEEQIIDIESRLD